MLIMGEPCRIGKAFCHKRSDQVHPSQLKPTRDCQEGRQLRNQTQGNCYWPANVEVGHPPTTLLGVVNRVATLRSDLL
jgi:hypothetical protein